MSRPARLVVVFGTGTEVGKTWVSCRLLEAARASGLAVAARKPAQSFEPSSAAGAGVAVAAEEPTDAELLAAATGEEPTAVCPAHRWYPVAMAPPMAATALGRPPILLADLVDETSWSARADLDVAAAAGGPRSPIAADLGLVETAGGPRSPIAHDGDGVDLARAIDPDVAVLVADAGLGTINAVRLCAAAIAPWQLVVYLNRFDPADALHIANRRWLEGVDHLHVVTTPAAALAALR